MKRFSFLTILIVPFVLSAQESADSLRREVTIEKDFTPIVRDASKINTLPEVEAPTVTRQSIQYSDWTVPAPLEARAVLLPPGGFGDPARENLKRGYFDFGLGNYWNMAGNAGYRILQSEKDQLGVWWQHRSTCGTVDYNQQLPGYETSRTMRQLEERVVADYRHTFEKLDLGIRGGYRYNSFNYYGLRFPGVQGIASPGQEINRFFLKSQIASNNPEAQLHYRASLAYHRYGYRRGYLQGDKGAAENWVEADFALTAPIDKSSDITVDGSFDYIGYSQLPSASGYGMLSLNPRYSWHNDRVSLSAGVRADISFNDGTIFRFAPDVRFDWTIVPNLQFYTWLTGGKQLNTWHRVSAYTLYFNPSAVADNSYIPLDVRLGLRVNALRGFSIGLSGGYEIGKRVLFLIPEQTDDAQLTGVSRFWGIDAYAFKAGLDLAYRYGSLWEASARVDYCRWTTTGGGQVVSYNRPQWQGEMKVRYNPLQKLSLEAGYQFAAVRKYGALGTLSDMHLVHVKASYAFTPWFSLYGLTDNVLNRKYDIAYGMPAQGINFLFGVDFKF
ncbi:hypothetical protein [Barnesiella viscericola]|uniref:hypothetical protein n=1 Tax=Barnesiella viscericola TaxID=397865 RepID=UPI00255BA124|nr:hypothetical protein [Barnesiella viscericola]